MRLFIKTSIALAVMVSSENAFRLSMIGAGGDLRVFWSIGLVGSMTTLAFVLLQRPLIGRTLSVLGRLRRPADS